MNFPDSEKARIVTEIEGDKKIMMIMTDGLIPTKSEKVQTHLHSNQPVVLGQNQTSTSMDGV